ncbi:MAG: aquaporin, partial [Promicromonosporaceae bacterium]|nr:aquaporin [Promicromonosporaceae bacterium]
MSASNLPYLAESSVVIDVSEEPLDTPGARYGLLARLGAETVGSFMLVFGILGVLAFNAVNNFQALTVALTAGLLLMAAFSAFAHVSGGHFNPAISLGAAITGRLAWRDLLPYWLVQVVGAVVAAVVVWAVVPETWPPMVQLADRSDLFANAANGWADLSPLANMTGGATETAFVGALLIEVIAAALLMMVFISVAGRARRAGSLAAIYGFTFTGLYLLTWALTNAGLNPVRSLAPLLFAGSGEHWGQLWLFVLAPLAGAALAGLSYVAFGPAPAIVEEVEFIDGDDDAVWVLDDDAEVDLDPAADEDATDLEEDVPEGDDAEEDDAEEDSEA